MILTLVALIGSLHEVTRALLALIGSLHLVTHHIISVCCSFKSDKSFSVICNSNVLYSVLQKGMLTTGSVQATDRLLKELREIYRSDNFKHGEY
jgi:hypothetical protein